MTRIIQRCLLVLAFTGVLLSSARETTVSDLTETTISSEQTSPSTLESSSSYSTQTFSFAPVVKSENEPSSQSDILVSSTPKVSDFSSVSNDSNSDKAHSGDEAAADELIKSKRPYTTEDTGTEYRESSTRISTSILSHSSGLFKAEPQDSESYESDKIQTFETTSKISGQSPGTDNAEISNHSHVQNRFDDGLPENQTVSENESETTSELLVVSTGTEMSESDKVEYENVTHDSGQSAVPSVEELIYNSSYVNNKHISKNTYSTTPSKVITDGKQENDLKSATRKRSLNATNAATSSGQTSSTSAIHLTHSPTHSQLSTQITPIQPYNNAYDKVLLMNKENAVESITSIQSKNYHVENNDEIIATESSSRAEIMTPTVHTAVQNSNREIESEQMVPKTSNSPDVTQMSDSSSAALSTLSGESIHSSVSIGNKDQISHTVPELYTTLKPSEKEIETEGGPSASSSTALEYEWPLVTFDPNGMTNNFTQDPDSVTFLPNVFHVDGIPTDAYLSRLEAKDSLNNTSVGHESIIYTDNSTHASKNLEDKLDELEVLNSSEREKEFILSSQNLAPHDEPYKEDIDDREMLSSTKNPVDYKHSTGYTQATSLVQNSKFPLYPLNDESEEMLNDAPQFVHSKFTLATTTEVKNEEMTNTLRNGSQVNVSNGISYTIDYNLKSTPETVNELDTSVVYQTDQSVIRPVTVISPSQTFESITLLPDVLKVEPHSASEATKAEQPDISSPIILPNPAPTVLNQSLEATTVVLQPDLIPERNMTKLEANTTNQITNSSIAGLAVKTSVSVSIPMSKVSNESFGKPKEQAEKTEIQSLETVSSVDTLYNGTDDKSSSAVPTEAPAVSNTDSSEPSILKPKIKVPGRSDTTRTRKPYVPPHQRQTTTSGPPVSIFKKTRQRISSITSSTTARPIPQFSTVRIHYASRMPPEMVPGGELVFSAEPIRTTTIPTTTETEEPFSDVPFTEQTQVPIVTNEDDVTLVKVAGFIVFDKGLRWTKQLDNRHSPQYKERANFVHLQLERLFRTSSIAPHLWKIQIDGFSEMKNGKSVAVDFFLYLIKSENEIPADSLATVFHEKLKNNTFSRFIVNPNKTSFEFLTEEPLKAPTPPPEKEPEPMIPQWAIAVIVVGAASLIFIILFAAVTILGRHHVRRRYSKKLNDEDADRPGDWESKMAAAYENLAADTIYDAEDLHSETYKKSYNSTYHGRPSRTSGPRRADSWSSSDWSPPPRRPRPQVHRIVY